MEALRDGRWSVSGLCLAGGALVLALLVSAARAPSASAEPAQEAHEVFISGRSPLPARCIEPGGGAYRHSEVEPSLAVNPTNRRNIVVGWQQDRYAEGAGAVADVGAVSQDGGRTWRGVIPRKVTTCNGGAYPRASDPWLTIGEDGAAYFTTLLVETSGEPSAIAVHRSTDEGRSFGRPTFPTRKRDLFNDREALTAHPRIAGRLYAVWTDLIPVQAVTYLSKSFDGGRSWSEPLPIFTAAPFTTPVGSEVFVLPDGSLLHVFALVNDSDQIAPEGNEVPSQIMAARSENDGLTWSPPIVIGQGTFRDPPDPGGGPSLSAPLTPSAGITRDGTAYVAWINNLADGDPRRLLFAKSVNGGRNWGRPRVIRTLKGNGFIPTLATSGSVVGLTWYDIRNDRTGDAELTTDVWFAHSHDRGRTWEESHLAGPIDFRSAPTKGPNPFLADYNGLDGLGGGRFAAATAVSKPVARIGRSDILFTRILTRPPRPLKVTCRGRSATIVGSRGDDRLVGTAGRDVIVGFRGADTLRGKTGEDRICGRAGGDTLIGGEKSDTLFGARQNDDVSGRGGNDRLLGGVGPDTLQGGSQRDRCRGGAGRDTRLGCER